MALRWGIASAGSISHDFVTALGTLPSDEHQVVAVAARDMIRAQKFADRHDIPKAYGDDGYADLGKDPEVDIVYIGAQNPQHLEIAMLMLEHGKHVLCEKPLCMNEKEVQRLIKYAEIKKLFLMEAIWSRFFPSYQYLRRQIDSGNLGTIEAVNVSFGFELEDVDRMTKKKQGGGTILDLGVYTVQLAQWAFGEPPKSIKATGTLNDDGCDMEMQAELQYSTGVAKIRTSALEKLDNRAVIRGSKGTITLNDFWSCLTLVDIDGQTKTWPLPDAKHKFNFMNSCGLRYEAIEARKCIGAGKWESRFVSHNDSIVIARIEDELRKQVGVKYNVDDY